MTKKRQKRTENKLLYIIVGLIIFGISSGKVIFDQPHKKSVSNFASRNEQKFKIDKDYSNLEDVPNYDGESKVVTINKNYPNFSSEELLISKDGWQKFSELDDKNRVGVANALLTKKMMPTERRTSIKEIYPTGWHQKKLSDKTMFYNRSHLIGYQFTGENANAKNLFTGTTELNQNIMRIYEDTISSYIRRTNHTVRYRVTPFFKEEELVARGVQMEAQSIEDTSIQLNIFIYNIQPGYTIDYRSGYSKVAN